MATSVLTRRVLVVALGFTVAITAIVGGLALTSSVNAATYTTATNGPVNWTGGGAWSCIPGGPGAPTCPAGSYPGGQGIAGDIANVQNTPQLTVNTAVPAAVTLNTNNGTGASVTVASGGSLGLTGSSAVTGTSGLNTLTIQGGSVTNSGTLTVGAGSSGGHLDFVSGLLNGAGATGIASNGVFNITGTAGSMTIDQQTVNNVGTANFTSGNSLTLSNSATITNAGTFNANGTGPINAGAGTVLFSNPGIMQKSGGGVFVLAAPFTNTSTATLAGSALEMDFTGGSGPTGQSNATWNLGLSGVMKFGGTQVFNNAQTFPAASGTVFFEGPTMVNTTPSTMTLGAGLNLTNNGTLDFSPTTTHSISLAGGNFVQAGGATVRFKLGPTNGVSDAINIAGSAAFAGTLVAALATGYTPADGDAFTVITDASQVGTFSYTPLPYANGRFQIVYNATNVVLVAAPEADISLLKTGPASVLNGQNATFTIKVGNAGPSAASSIVISDSFTNATFVSASVPGGSCVGTGPVNCTIPSLASGSNVFITIVVKASSAGTIANTATRTSSTPADPNSVNDSSTFNVTVNPAADLNIGVSGPATAPAGSAVNFTATISNPSGPDAANNPTVNFSLTNGTITGASGGGFSCSNTPTTATCTDLSPLGVGGSGTITISTTAPNQAGTMTLTGNVSSTTGDPNAANNTASAAVTITAVSDLSITKVASGPPVAGQNVTYNIVVTNIGPSDASSVSVTDTPGAGLTFVSNSGACATNFPCTFVTLAAGSSITINSTFSVASSAAGTISNTASVSSSTTDPAPGNNSSTATDAVSTSADLAITKTLSGSLVAGQNATYTITVTNNGPSDATNVTVADATPAQTTFVSNSGACTTAFPCNLGTMTAGQVLTITSTYAVSPSATGTISNTATVSSTTPDPNAANNTATSSAALGTSADLSITKTASSPFVAGQNATYTITVTNSGPSDAASVTVSDTLPAALTFVSNSGACTTSFPCSLGTVTAGSTMTITTTVQVASNASGSVTNTASVSSTTADPVSANNSSTATTTIGTSADVSITKALSSSLVAGSNATYTITVTNNGPSDATNVTVADATPAQTTFVSNSGACTSAFPCSLGTMTPGQVLTITSTYAVSPSATGSISNTATVSSTTPDPAPANNTATSSAALGSSANLSITKVASSAFVAGQNATYTISVTNSGPSDAAGVTVSDTLPAPLTFVSNSGACTTAFPCSIGTVTAGSTVTITTTVQVSSGASGSVNNTASVSSTTADPVPANNSSTATTTIGTSADVSITKALSSSLVAGTNATYTITVTNNGPSDAGNVTVADPTPAQTTFVSNSGACTSAFPCNLGTMTPGQVLTITSTYAVSPSATGSISNTATVSSSTSDPAPANNTATSSAALGSSADLSITKTGPASATPGQTITYTITVTNNGPSASSSTTVSDPTPAGLTFVSNSGSCTTPYPCAIGALAAGSSATITSTYTVNAGASGSITNTASVSGSSFDPNTSNNSASATTTLTPAADLQITKTGPSTLPPSGSVTFTITVKNLGPSSATGVVVNDTPVRLIFVSNSGGCTTPFPCNLGTLAPLQIVTINSTFNVVPNSTSATNTATVSSSTSDGNSSNNSSSVTLTTSCPTSAPSITSPTPGQTDVPLAGTIQWIGNGSTRYDVNLGPAAAGGCSMFVATVFGTSYGYSGLSPNTDYEVSVVGTKPGCPAIASQCVRFRTGGSPCNLTTPQLLLPLNGSTVTSPVTFSWSGNGETYRLVAALNGVTALDVATAATSFTANLGNGTVTWSVTANAKSCTEGVPSATGSFNVCSPPAPPHAGVVGAPSSGRQYSVVVVDPQTNALYEFQEADNDSFNNPLTQTSSTPSVSYTHSTTTNALVFFYRVRALSSCANTPGPYSKTVRVVIVPITVNLRSPSVNVPAGSKDLVVQQVFIPGESAPVAFTATADRPWIIKIDPSSGILPTEGITLNVTIDPALLPNGTFTATVIISFPSLSTNGRIAPNANTGKSAPITINLVTPVVPNDRTGPTADSLIIPAVGRLIGLNSQWRSDVRIFNNSPQKLKYLLNFVAQGSSEVKQTTIETDVGATTALDDIIHNWYGFGEVGDSATGVLEVRPLPPDSGPASALTTILSSRTYSLLGDGTLGQYIPAVPFKNFVGAGSRLSMQQIAQSSAYRTNFAVIEASGSPVSVLLSMFNSGGTKLFDLPVNLAGGEQKLLNGLLAQQGVSLTDGRMEVTVTGGDGKVTAYASVVDNLNADPLFVPGKLLGAETARSYVVPGVADLNNGAANWRTDMRIFNSGSVAQAVDLTFYQANNAAAPRVTTVTVNPNEVKVLDSVLASVFSATNVGGAVHADTAVDSQLVVTGRTYNQTSSGTLGQFIPAATPSDGVDRAGRALNILQVEDSPRYRTNVGLAEMSGKPSTVEISVSLPDSKVTPIIQVPLAANEFRQFGLAEFGLGNVYNARVSVKVVDGDGRVTAYGSVIDQVTTAPTYIAPQ